MWCGTSASLLAASPSAGPGGDDASSLLMTHFDALLQDFHDFQHLWPCARFPPPLPGRSLARRRSRPLHPPRTISLRQAPSPWTCRQHRVASNSGISLRGVSQHLLLLASRQSGLLLVPLVPSPSCHPRVRRTTRCAAGLHARRLSLALAVSLSRCRCRRALGMVRCIGVRWGWRSRRRGWSGRWMWVCCGDCSCGSLRGARLWSVSGGISWS